MKPFTIEQLRSLYYNFELEHVEEFVDTFLQVGEMLYNYMTDTRIEVSENSLAVMPCWLNVLVGALLYHKT